MIVKGKRNMNSTERKQELLESGLVDSIKWLFPSQFKNIPEKYYILMADYIDSIAMLHDAGGTNLDALEIARRLPGVVEKVSEKNLGGIYGVTDHKQITMSSSLGEEANKLYFFHELTHALQIWEENGIEHCGFANGHNGLFFAEASAQYTAEILYHISNGTALPPKTERAIRGQPGHTAYSFLSEYQLNGNILELFTTVIGMSLGEVLDLGFDRKGREKLENEYNTKNMLAGSLYPSFNELMDDLEKVYDIDKAIIAGYGNLLAKRQVSIHGTNNQVFYGSLSKQEEWITKTEQNLSAAFISFNDNDYIEKKYPLVENCLTTPKLKQNFVAGVEMLLGKQESISQKMNK